jgi:hypothetical protein
VSTHVGLPDLATGEPHSPAIALRDYFFSDAIRGAQTLLGLIWCLDGGLKFQAFMYSRGFVAFLKSGAVGQPAWLHDSIIWGANLAGGNLTIWMTLFGLIECVIGFGLLYRPAVKPAIVLALFWTFVISWFGEGFGMLFMGMAQPATGAPGVLTYGLVALLIWPSATPGGLLSARGAKILWAALWLIEAYLWLIPASAATNATSQMLTSTPSGIAPLASVQRTLASGLSGGGIAIALTLALVSAGIGIGVAAGWRARPLLYLSIALNLVYWVLTESFGGIFAGGSTDPNVGPLFMLLALAMLPVISDSRPERNPAGRTDLTTPNAAASVGS